MGLLLIVMLLLTSLTGCGETAEQEEKFILSVCVCNQIESLDPAMNTNIDAQSIFYSLYENLMRYTDDGTGTAALSSGMAKEYTEVGNYDGTVSYEFSLRSTARWSDGKKVTADDFVYAWQRLVDPATDSPNHALLNMVRGYDEVRETGDVSSLAVSAKGDDTFCVTLSAPCAYFIDGICTDVATMPLRRDMVEKDSENWASTVNIVTNGAYRVGTWTKEASLQTKRNEKYYESRLVGPDAVRFVFAPDAESAYGLYESGEVDYISHLPQRVLEQPGEEQNWTETPIFATYCVLYNHLTDEFSDAHARKAFDLAIDRAAIAAAAGAEATPADGLVPTGVRDSEDGADYRIVGGSLCAVDEETYSDRCAAALGEITAAGNYRGMGFPIVDYLYSTEDDIGSIVALALAKQWREKLNIEVQLKGVTQEEYDALIEAGDFTLAGQYLAVQRNDAMGFLESFSSSREDNALRYSNHTYDVLMGVAEKSDNAVARIAFLHDAEAMLLEDTALSPVLFGARSHMLREGLQGIYYDGLGNTYFSNITQIPAEQ